MARGGFRLEVSETESISPIANSSDLILEERSFGDRTRLGCFRLSGGGSKTGDVELNGGISEIESEDGQGK